MRLRSYQLELAEIALSDRNTIICAQTGTGKTWVALHITKEHLLKNPQGSHNVTIVFIIKGTTIHLSKHLSACVTENFYFQGELFSLRGRTHLWHNSTTFSKSIYRTERQALNLG